MLATIFRIPLVTRSDRSSTNSVENRILTTSASAHSWEVVGGSLDTFGSFVVWELLFWEFRPGQIWFFFIHDRWNIFSQLVPGSGPHGERFGHTPTSRPCVLHYILVVLYHRGTRLLGRLADGPKKVCKEPCELQSR
jgi:hypothetical protein